MFKIVVADGKQELPDDDIYYIVAKEGIFIKKKLGIMDSVSPVKNISILKSVQATAKMNIEKIPSISIAKVSNFFRAVQKEHRSEAIVLLFYNEKTKKYKLFPPAQKVSPASIEYNRAVVIDGWTMIGDIHSHSSMSAFHSGTDQGDEESFDGLHITFGNMNSDLISISASIVSNGNRVIVKPEEYMKGIELKEEIDEVEQIPTTRVYRWINGKMVETTPKFTTAGFKTYRKYDKRYKVVSENAIKAQVPPSWLDAIEEHEVRHIYGNFNQSFINWPEHYRHGYPQFNRGPWAPRIKNGWNRNFDPDVWSRESIKVPPQNVGVKTKPITFPPHDQGPLITDITTPTKPTPCESCAFKERAIEYVAKIMVEKNQGSIEEQEDDIFDKESYECEKCNLIVSFYYDDCGEIKDDIICPSCKSDEHLTLLDIGLKDKDEDEDDDPYNFDDYLSDLKQDYKINCKTCGSQFDLSMTKKDDNGVSCPFCGKLLSTETESDLLDLDGVNIKNISEEEISNYKAAKENPNPSNIIPDPSKQMVADSINSLKQLFEKFRGNR